MQQKKNFRIHRINQAKHVDSTKSDFPHRINSTEISSENCFTNIQSKHQQKKNEQKPLLVAPYDKRNQLSKHIKNTIKQAQQTIKEFQQKQQLVHTKIIKTQQTRNQLENKLFKLNSKAKKYKTKLQKENDEDQKEQLETSVYLNDQHIQKIKKDIQKINKILEQLINQTNYWQDEISSVKKFIQQQTTLMRKKKFPIDPLNYVNQ